MQFRDMVDLLNDYTKYRKYALHYTAAGEARQAELSELRARMLEDKIAAACGDALDRQRVKTLMDSYARDTSGRWRTATVNALRRMMETEPTLTRRT